MLYLNASEGVIRLSRRLTRRSLFLGRFVLSTDATIPTTDGVVEPLCLVKLLITDGEHEDLRARAALDDAVKRFGICRHHYLFGKLSILRV